MTIDKPIVGGLHIGEHVGGRPVEEGHVAIGWHELGDLRNYPEREAYKAAIARNLPDKGHFARQRFVAAAHQAVTFKRSFSRLKANFCPKQAPRFSP